MSSLQIGKAIFSLLDGISVFPLIADAGATYPFVIYRRTNAIPSATKDMYNYKELVTLEVLVAASSYEQSVEVAELVREKLEHTRGDYNGISIGEVKMISGDENYLEDAFV
ncbi:MAG: DUF3168 domain-containing protein [Bacteroidaceae bacterium]|nr:DUF3168 domain-containing protein [Bacteroidaceae bacterium]